MTPTFLIETYCITVISLYVNMGSHMCIAGGKLDGVGFRDTIMIIDDNYY